MTTLFISHSSKDKAWAEKVREALRCRGHQSLFLDSHPDDGIQAGARWEQTLWQRMRQSRGLVVLGTRNWLSSPWCVAEAMLARERGKPIFLLAAADIVDGRQVKETQDGEQTLQFPDFLKDTQFISLAGLTAEDAFERLWRGLAAEGLKDDFPLPDRPYPGLEPFQETDAAVFFGRDEEIARVRGVLNRRKRKNAKGFLLILGASGCGKSSLVRAGVLPRLKLARGADAAGTWVIPPPFSGGTGLEGLASSLALAFNKTRQPLALSGIRHRLEPARQAAGGVTLAARALREFASDLLVAQDVAESHVLLLLDQLEEVFGTGPGSDARAMLQCLLEASADEASPVVVLATMRSDFLNAFQLFPGAAERYEEITLDPMPRSRFGELIEGPAQSFGLTLDAGFTERLVEDTRYDDALPLLAFTLARLYAQGLEDEVDKADKLGVLRALRLEKYQDLFPAVQVRNEDKTTTEYRGVSAAVKYVADEILNQTGYDATLPADDPRWRDLRRAFYSLTQVEGAGQFTRRTALWSQLPESCTAVLNQFVRQRLLVSRTEHGERTLSVAHEALFRVWDTLRLWLLQDRKALALRTQIEDAAAEWESEHRVESRLWPDERIVDAMREIGLSGVTIDDVAHPAIVRAFLGPTDPEEIVRLPTLSAAADAAVGSGRYGDTWRLPLSHEARASAGVRLALLGDQRAGVGIRADGLPDISWCVVSGGKILRQDAGAMTEVNVATFYIARYPVTWAQYRAFLTAPDGYRHPGWWQGLAHRDEQPGKQFQQYDNHPVDNVSWFDALAYCRWLSSRLGYAIQLPTEWEWQQAATGGNPAYSYPWGTSWAAERSNIYDSRVNRTTAVGMYPHGASPVGALDMCGNVWEWCLDESDQNLTDQYCPKGYRALRGGAWNFNADQARSDARNWECSAYRFTSVGFRLACSSPTM